MRRLFNKKLYGTVESVAEKGDNSRIQFQKDLTSELTSICHYAGDIAAVAIVSEDGLLREYGALLDRQRQYQFMD